ncbi:MAG: DUF1826 domain-containing protein [Cytophagales bacterium]|nr:DUF1826 domain-containing protein [Cytophagales bacterium]
MNWLTEIIGTHKEQAAVNQLIDLHLIHHKKINLVYHKRKADADITHYANLLIDQNFSGINAVVTPTVLESAIGDALDQVGFHTVGKVKLKEDIINLTDLFFRVTHATNVRLILKVVTHNACAKFHTDGYALRLLCTYAGLGTEWIADEYVNRKKLIQGTNEEIIKDFTKVQTMQPFEVAILKGETKLTGTHGIVHRSPPIEQAGAKRLLLRLDF